MGLDIYLYDGEEPDYTDDREAWKAAFDETHNTKSPVYPDHLCGPRYLRSSYNSGGFNSVVGDLLGKDLYYIFENNGEYDWCPSKEELESARVRGEEVLAELQKVERPLAAFDVTSLGSVVNSDAEAIAVTKQKLAEGLFSAFSTREGYFDKEGTKVVGIVPGQGFMGTTTYIVHEISLDWYLQMAEIVLEFIDTALALNDPRIYWSG